jgi:hypothetical protein
MSHQKERPIQVVWELSSPMPVDRNLQPISEKSGGICSVLKSTPKTSRRQAALPLPGLSSDAGGVVLCSLLKST